MSNEEEQMLDEALTKTYADKGSRGLSKREGKKFRLQKEPDKYILVANRELYRYAEKGGWHVSSQ